MNKYAHALFPFNVFASADYFDDPASISLFTKNYVFASAPWLSGPPPSLLMLLMLFSGAILPDTIDKLFSNHKRSTHLQHRKDRGEWLTDSEFDEMVQSKQTWWKLHRTLSHWWPIPIILYAAGLEPLALGWGSHLLLDAMTPMGIPKLVPFPSDTEAGYMRIPLLSGMKGLEWWVTVSMTAVFIWLLFVL